MYALGASSRWPRLASSGAAVEAAPGRYRGASDAEREHDLRRCCGGGGRDPRRRAGDRDASPAAAEAVRHRPRDPLGARHRHGHGALIGGPASAAGRPRFRESDGGDALSSSSAARRPRRPAAHARAESWPMIVRETWVQGFTFRSWRAVGAAMVWRARRRHAPRSAAVTLSVVGVDESRSRSRPCARKAPAPERQQVSSAIHLRFDVRIVVPTRSRNDSSAAPTGA